MRSFNKNTFDSDLAIEQGYVTQEAWHYSLTFNPDVIDEYTLCFLDGYEAEFIKQYTVAAGNFYNLCCGHPYPEYCYGSLTSRGARVYARLSKHIAGCDEFADCFVLHISNESNPLDHPQLAISTRNNKPLMGLMQAFAICLFFRDSDYAFQNIVCLETENSINVIKIDPEGAFGKEFFTKNLKDVLLATKFETLIKSNLFLKFENELIEALTNSFIEQEFEFNIDETIIKEAVTLYIHALLLTGKDEFYQTINNIITKIPEQISIILNEHIDVRFNESKNRLAQALALRVEYFKNINLCHFNKVQEVETQHTSQNAELTFVKMAKLAIGKLDIEKAYKILNFACANKLSENNYVNFSLRGDLHFQQENLNEAISDYKRAIQTNGLCNPDENNDLIHCCMNIAKIYKLIMLKNDAIEYNQYIIENLKNVLKYQPNHETACLEIGNAYFNLKQYENANYYYTIALNINPISQEIQDKISLINILRFNINQINKSQSIVENSDKLTVYPSATIAKDQHEQSEYWSPRLAYNYISSSIKNIFSMFHPSQTRHGTGTALNSSETSKYAHQDGQERNPKRRKT